MMYRIIPINEAQTKWVIEYLSGDFVTVIKTEEVSVSPVIKLLELNCPTERTNLHQTLGLPSDKTNLFAVFSTESKPNIRVNAVQPYDLWYGDISEFESVLVGRIKLYDWFYDKYIHELQMIHAGQSPYEGMKANQELPETKEKFIVDLIYPVVQFEIQRAEIARAISEYISKNSEFKSVRIFVRGSDRRVVGNVHTADLKPNT